MATTWNTETGWYYLQTRYYDPVVRRFISADNYELIPYLAKNIGELNLYSYCNNNPVMYTDSTGQWWFFDEIWGGIKKGAQSVSDFFTNTVPDFFVNTVYGQGIKPAWDATASFFF